MNFIGNDDRTVDFYSAYVNAFGQTIMGYSID